MRMKLLIWLRDRCYKWKLGEKQPITLNILYHLLFPPLLKAEVRRQLVMNWSKFHRKRLCDRKFRFIVKFHARRPGKYCWADCVGWAYNSGRFNPYKIDGPRGCEVESKEHSTGMCYCGQWMNGKCWDLMSKEEQDKWQEDNKPTYEVDPLPF